MWINVKDSLPEPNVEVMVAMDAGIVRNPSHPSYPGNKWLEKSYRLPKTNSFMTELLQTGHVTHWMHVENWDEDCPMPKD